MSSRGTSPWAPLICLASLPSCTLLMPPSPFVVANEMRQPASVEATQVEAAVPVSGNSVRLRSGTGFFISYEGFVLTNAHTVLGCDHVSIWNRHGAMSDARIRAVDPDRDIALLESGINAPEIAAAPVSAQPRMGEPVSALGFGVHARHPLVPAVARGGFAGTGNDVAGRAIWAIHAPIRPGTSGGLVVDSDGSMLGMVIGYDTDRPSVGVILPAPVIAEFLAARGLHLGAGRSALLRGPVVRYLLNVSVLVQCGRLKPAIHFAPPVYPALQVQAADPRPSTKQPRSEGHEYGDGYSGRGEVER